MPRTIRAPVPECHYHKEPLPREEPPAACRHDQVWSRHRDRYEVAPLRHRGQEMRRRPQAKRCPYDMRERWRVNSWIVGFDYARLTRFWHRRTIPVIIRYILNDGHERMPCTDRTLDAGRLCISPFPRARPDICSPEINGAEQAPSPRIGSRSPLRHLRGKGSLPSVPALIMPPAGPENGAVEAPSSGRYQGRF